ncbi:MAG: hypothetical protein JWO45_1844 [Spartobacteria bacterium]|nr:hypothetical protein [Spartobacteria bacterium]
MIHQKQDCIDSITRALEATSAWRKLTAARFPDDPRNIKAAETLEELAAGVTDLSEENWLELAPYFSFSDTWRKGLSTTARQVGFFHRSKNFDVFAKLLGDYPV